RHRGDGGGIEAARVDAEAVGMGARHVERFHAADRAEEVLRGAGVEGVSGEHIPAREQGEALRGHDEVQVTGLAADRAVALVHGDPGGGEDLETQAAAVAAAGVLYVRAHAVFSSIGARGPTETRDSSAPISIIAPFSQNTGGMPNAEPTAPNT